MKQRLKKLPKFKSEDEEREFWDTHNSTDYFDWSKAKQVIFPNLKKTADKDLAYQSVSIRFPTGLLDSVREKASKLKIPYQTLMKKYIASGVMEKKK